MIIKKADKALVLAGYHEAKQNQEGRNPSIFHASSTGHCIRKVLVDYLIANADSPENPEWINAYSKENVSLQGIFNIGNRAEQRIASILNRDLLVYADKHHNREKLKTKMFLGDEQGAIIDVHGEMDLILCESTMHPKFMVVDTKTFDTTQLPILEKKMHEEDGVIFVSPKYKHACQLTCYMLGLQEQLKQFDFYDPHVLMVCKGNDAHFWARVKTEDYASAVQSYWLDVADALHYWTMEKELPPATPIEKWECRWGKKISKTCKYYHLCFPKLDELDKELNECSTI